MLADHSVPSYTEVGSQRLLNGRDRVPKRPMILHAGRLWENGTDSRHLERAFGGCNAECLQLPSHRIALGSQARIEMLSNPCKRGAGIGLRAVAGSAHIEPFAVRIR